MKHEDALRAQAERLESRGHEIYRFHEPDRDNELTAIATPPIFEESKRKHFKKMQLLHPKCEQKTLKGQIPFAIAMLDMAGLDNVASIMADLAIENDRLQDHIDECSLT